MQAFRKADTAAADAETMYQILQTEEAKSITGKEYNKALTSILASNSKANQKLYNTPFDDDDSFGHEEGLGMVSRPVLLQGKMEACDDYVAALGPAKAMHNTLSFVTGAVRKVLEQNHRFTIPLMMLLEQLGLRLHTVKNGQDKDAWAPLVTVLNEPHALGLELPYLSGIVATSPATCSGTIAATQIKLICGGHLCLLMEATSVGE